MMNRKTTQTISSFLFPIILIGGTFQPYLGLVVGVMMISFLILSYFRARLWCSHFCPRGGFLERWWVRLSLDKHIPLWIIKPKTKMIFFFIMMFFMIFRIYHAWGNWLDIGGVFVMMCIVTTLIALPLGFLFKPRTWCAICPMGQLQGKIGKLSKIE